MKIISHLGEEVGVVVETTPSHRGNEAELTKATIRYKVNGVINEQSVLLRECLWGDKTIYNEEIRYIYDRLLTINTEYEQSGSEYQVNVVKHFTDEQGNIYVKDLNPTGNIYAYDLLPDGYYLDIERRPKSRFGEFKKAVTDLKLNRPSIIGNVFEQLAVLHANHFVVGKLIRGEMEMSHPTLSLFICRLKNKPSGTDTKIFIHDIHNLSEFTPSSEVEYAQRCVHDLRDLSFDIIRFFKGIGLPYGGFSAYGKALQILNPELYLIMYKAFLWNPGIEIETMAMSYANNGSKEEKKESVQVITRINRDSEEDSPELKKMFQSDEIFLLASKKKKIQKFLDDITKENTEFIFDFDGTLTSPLSKNAFHAARREDESFGMDTEIIDSFIFRKGAIAFLRLLLASGFEVKIHSLGFKEVISQVLIYNGIVFPTENIFANDLNAPVFSKTDVPISLNHNKKQIILGDNIIDFSIKTTYEPLKIGFLTSGKQIQMNKEVDFYHMEDTGDYIYLYQMFRRFFGEK